MMELEKFNMLKVVVVLARVGIVITENHRWMATICSAILLLANVISGWLYLFYNGVGIQALAKTMVPISFGTVVFTCVALSVVHRENYIKLINEAMREFETEFPGASKESKRDLFMVNVYVFGFAFSGSVVFGLYMVDPFFQKPMILPFPIWFPFRTDTTALFALAYFIEMSFNFLGAIVLLVTALFFCNLLGQTCLRVENLVSKIRDVLEYEQQALVSSKETDENLSSSLQEFLKECVQTHIKLRSRIRVIDETFSTFFLVGVLGYVPTVSCSILEFVSYGSEETVIYYMKFGSVMVSGLYLVFVLCHCATRIVDAQLKIPETLLSHKWTRYPVRIQRTLSIIFAVGQVPVSVTAGGIMTLDLVGYSQITGLVYSIFTLLNHFKSNADTSPI